MQNGILHATVAIAMIAAPAAADVVTNPTTSPADLAAALHPVGLKILSVEILNGSPAQVGTYSDFTLTPVMIGDGIVMGSGDISSLGPLAEAQDPDYDPAGPPARVNSAMDSGATQEFTDYGETSGAITNFFSVNDVAAIKVVFELPEDSNVKFDFVFGSVEFPVWTSMYTDAFVVFLDDTAAASQNSYDGNGSAIQVGQSFANLVTTADRNTAFSAPHGMIKSLTTTTPFLESGEHTLWIEVGDVNDMVLDSAVFITNLRAEAGNPGTGQTGCEADLDGDDFIGGSDLSILLTDWGGTEQDIDGNGVVGAGDLAHLLADWGPCS